MKLIKLLIKKKNINNLKILLANRDNKNIHGEKAAKKAADTANQLLKGGIGSDLPEIKIKNNKLQKRNKNFRFISF